MSKFSFWDSDGVENAPDGAMFGKRTRKCIYCGNETKRKIVVLNEEFWNIKRVYRYCCQTCKKETSPWTQFGFEYEEKLSKKIIITLRKIYEELQIKKVWYDVDGNSFDGPIDVEKFKKSLFIVNIGEQSFSIPCCYSIRLNKYFETPIGIKEDINMRREMHKFKKYVKRLSS